MRARTVIPSGVESRVLRVVASAALTLFAVTAAYAQNPDEIAKRQALEVAARVPLEKPIKGAPYSADTVVEATQTLADGNHITTRTNGRVFRDGEGRIRREDERSFTMATPNGPASNKMVTVSIVDPVADVSYTLDAERQIAWKTPLSAGWAIMGKVEASQVEARRREEQERLQAAGARGRQGGAGTLAPAVEPPSSERRGRGAAFENNGPLEHRTIEGLAVEGHRMTRVIAAGEIGNDLPITITSEEWSSPELKVLVMTRHSDPRTGESTYRLTNIVRAEPDGSLFQVPPGYTIKETGISKLEVRRRQ
jgi:hypothetical protein